MTTADTKSFLVRALEGDVTAKNRLLERVRPRLVLWVASHLSASLRSKIEAEDVAQEVLLAAHRGMESFRGEDPRAFHAWLFRIAENRIKDLVDYNNALKRQGSDLGSLTQTSPSTRAIRNETVDQVQRAIASLPEDYRQVIRLRKIEGLEVEEVAGILDRTDNAVRILYCRAVKALREALENNEGREMGTPDSR